MAWNPSLKSVLMFQTVLVKKWSNHHSFEKALASLELRWRYFWSRRRRHQLLSRVLELVSRGHVDWETVHGRKRQSTADSRHAKTRPKVAFNIGPLSSWYFDISLLIEATQTHLTGDKSGVKSQCQSKWENKKSRVKSRCQYMSKLRTLGHFLGAIPYNYEQSREGNSLSNHL